MLSTRVNYTYVWLIRCDHVRADRRRRLLRVQGKNFVRRRNARHFCITTTSQIIVAAAAPAAPLSTPVCIQCIQYILVYVLCYMMIANLTIYSQVELQISKSVSL